ncbi:PQQ-dependent sugar dehydrogenase [Roseobacter fucihabitans]|nr:PQQ-dependent sugar dehydrogenase [Roseobacter litoralis]
MPDQEFRVGGALALWNDDVIVQHSRGTILVLDEEKGLIKTDLAVPENGLEAYIRLAADKYPDQIAKDYAVRYNDLEFIDSPAFRGFLSSYTFIDVENECYRSRISKLDIPRSVTSIYDLTASAGDWEIIYDSSPCLEFNDTRELLVGYMAGGRLAFKEPNIVYLGNGEYHREGLYRPDSGIQSDDSDYGKTIEINLTTGQSRHYSKGHRNLQGVALDSQGRLWTTEHGMRGGDELNLIVDQENYGWPLENLGTLYSGIPAPTEGRVGRHEIYRGPVYAWLPSAAVSSLALVEGFHETWDGDLLIGSLRERTLFRARIKDDQIVFLETIPIGQRIRDVMQVGPKKLALWLDTEEVVILETEPRVDPLTDLVIRLTEKGMAADMAETARDVLTGCNECHSYEENVHGAGPSLHNVAGRRIASTAFANYSTSLRGTTGVWDAQSLTTYLTDPEVFAPGTAMAGLGVGNPEIASAVAAAFEELYAPVEYE